MAESKMHCTRYTTLWCPSCGECLCARTANGSPCYDSANCPLHGADSKHADTQSLAQAESIVDDLARRQNVSLTAHDRGVVSRFAQMLAERKQPAKDFDEILERSFRK